MESQGFTHQAQAIIAAVVREYGPRSGPNKEKFVDALLKHGLPIAEGRYIFGLLEQEV